MGDGFVSSISFQPCALQIVVCYFDLKDFYFIIGSHAKFTAHILLDIKGVFLVKIGKLLIPLVCRYIEFLE